ncbi:MAG TPA: RNA-binding cell elongation regulator Jag/EloR [Anaerolineaceae bacterium]|jgi:spoIIIJ-associated protein|nr:RNA-binding cell elongation regulator Jag/EloR [Anaerolineaceae bacterium]
MSKERTTLEVLAPTVEEAIEKGLEQLGLNRDDVDVEVLDEGKRNLFRFASKQARVKLTVLENILEPESQETDEISENEDGLNFGEMFEAELKGSQSVPVDLDNTDVESVVQKTVAELLRKMEVQAGVSVRKVYQEDEGREVIYVNIEGSDMSFLIGRRAETLNALQYITSLIINKKLNQWVPLQLDVQNFRNRRETELQKLARRMAEQVVSTGKRQCLEPMPANERRIVHIELRKNELVYTESIGEEPNRKICIYPAE